MYNNPQGRCPESSGSVFVCGCSSAGSLLLKTDVCLGNTARRLCANCAVSFFVRLHRFSEGILPYFKEKMCNMTEKMQVSCVQSLQAVFVRCCLYIFLLDKCSRRWYNIFLTVRLRHPVINKNQGSYNEFIRQRASCAFCMTFCAAFFAALF